MTGKRILSAWLTDAPFAGATNCAGACGTSNSNPLLKAALKVAYGFSPLAVFDAVPSPKHNAPLFLGLNVDITGSIRFFGGEEAIIIKFSDQLREAGLASKIAICSTLGAAWGVSRFGKERLTIVSPTRTQKALAALPVRALRIDRDLEESLSELQIFKVDEVLRLSRSSLLNRFGPGLLTVIDRALGTAEEPIPLQEKIPLFRTGFAFDGPTTQTESIEEISRQLLDELLEKLAHRSLKPSSLTLEVIAEPKLRTVKTFSLNLPTASSSHLWTLLKTQLEKVQLGLGVLSITLSAPATAPIESHHHAVIPEAAPSAPSTEHSTFKPDPGTRHRLAQLIDRANEELGKHNVLSPRAHESYFPEKTFSFIPAQLAGMRRSPETLARVIEAERPSILFYSPASMRALSVMPDGPPFSIEWRGQRYRIVKGVGPERIAPVWWGKDDSLMSGRDYFKVQLPCGTWLWVYRQLVDSEWFLHGIWV